MPPGIIVPSLPSAWPTAFQSGSASAGPARVSASNAVRDLSCIVFSSQCLNDFCPRFAGPPVHFSVSLAGCGLLQHPVLGQLARAAKLRVLARDPHLMAAT